jgi:cytochrome c oxidase subunit 4
MSAHAEHLAHEVHDHVPIYIKLAVFLSVVTAAEVGILFVALPAGLLLTGLYALATLKFVLVVAVFMHLKYDNKMLTGIFFSGFTIALATMIALISLINYQPTKTSIHVKNSKELAALSKGDPTKGPAVFSSKGCAACHTISSIAGAVGTVGPHLDGLGERASTRVAGLSAKDYITQSIETPNAFVVEGFASGLMPGNLKGSMTADEFKDLVSYLETL